MDLGLEGKTALVLGGGGGLGRAIAKALANEGANVAVAGIGSTSIDGTVADLKAIGGKCIGLIWDLADLSVINANISKIEERTRPCRHPRQQHRRPTPGFRGRSRLCALG